MLKLYNSNQRNFLKKLEIILNERKLKQRNQSALVRKILDTVQKQGDILFHECDDKNQGRIVLRQMPG